MATTTTANPTQDCGLDGKGDNRNTNYNGVTSTFGVKLVTAEYCKMHSLLQFNIPAGFASSDVQTAKLSLFCTALKGTPPESKVYRIASESSGASYWDEAQTTWNSRLTGTAWGTTGGDYSTVTPAGVTFTPPATTGAFDITGMETMVKYAIDLSTGTDARTLDVLLRFTSESDQDIYSRIATKEHTTATWRPVLSIDYQTSTGCFFSVRYPTE